MTMIPLEWVRATAAIVEIPECTGGTLGPDGTMPYDVSLSEAQSWPESCGIVVMPEFFMCLAREPIAFVEFLFSVGRISEETYTLVMTELTLEMVE